MANLPLITTLLLNILISNVPANALCVIYVAQKYPFFAKLLTYLFEANSGEWRSSMKIIMQKALLIKDLFRHDISVFQKCWPLFMLTVHSYIWMSKYLYMCRKSHWILNCEYTIECFPFSVLTLDVLITFVLICMHSSPSCLLKHSPKSYDATSVSGCDLKTVKRQMCV